jgi:hypothetical protein
VNGSGRRPRPHGVDEDGRLCTLEELDQGGAGAIRADDLRAGRRLVCQQPGRGQTAGIVPERTPDADDADQRRTTSRSRKCVAHEMHGS